MRKSLQLFVVGFLVFGLIVFNTASLLTVVSVKAETENSVQQSLAYEPTATENSILSFNFTKDYYAVGETIVATVQVSSPLTGQPSYDGNGAIVKSATLSGDRLTATIQMQITGTGEENSLILFFNIGEDILQHPVYFYSDRGCVFCNDISVSSTKLKAWNTLYDLGRLSSKELEEKQEEEGRACIVAEGEEVLTMIPDNLRQQLTETQNQMNDYSFCSESSIRATTGNTSVYGLLVWKSADNTINPLTQTTVKIYDKETLGQTLLGTVITNDNGEYSFSFNNDTGIFEKGYDIYIEVLAQTAGHIVFKENTSTIYSVKSEKYDNVSTGSNTNISMMIDMSNDTGKAFSISQAMSWAYLYATVMSDVEMGSIDIRYPISNNNSMYFDGSSPIIKIIERDYRNWDVLLHEYGHHFAYKNEFFVSVGLEHYFYEDLTHRYGKIIGIALAWNEAIATVFGMTTINFWADELQNISPMIHNFSYDVVDENVLGNNFSFNLESDSNYVFLTKEYLIKGETCEGAVGRALYDIYDTYGTDQDTNDFVQMGHSAFWNAVKASKAENFNTFYQYLINNNIVTKENLGNILSNHGISPYNINSNLSFTIEQGPQFVWSSGNAGTKRNVEENTTTYPQCPNDRFVVCFYSASGVELVRRGSFSAPLTTTSVTLTMEEWIEIIRAGYTFSVAVYGMSTAPLVTGWYLSGKTTFSIPTSA